MLANREVNGIKHIQEQLARFLSPRSVIVGIGNRDRLDDGFGPAVVDGLHERVSVPLVDAGISPENFVQLIAAHKPDAVLFLDTAEVSRPPGWLVLCGPDDLVEVGASCHTSNLALVARYITFLTGAKCLFLLAQPAEVCFAAENSGGGGDILSSGLSPPMETAIEQTTRMIMKSLPIQNGPIDGGEAPNP